MRNQRVSGEEKVSCVTPWLKTGRATSITRPKYSNPIKMSMWRRNRIFDSLESAQRQSRQNVNGLAHLIVNIQRERV